VSDRVFKVPISGLFEVQSCLVLLEDRFIATAENIGRGRPGK